MNPLIKNWKANAERNEEENFLFIRSLKSKNAQRVDRTARQLHKEAFEKIDCLTCGNCCRVLRPTLSKNDISNIAAYLQVTEDEIKEKYLELNQEGEWQTNASPCPFLNEDNNACQVYPSRPKACKDYPHTDKTEFAHRSYLHSQNTLDCPAAFYIVEKMKEYIR